MQVILNSDGTRNRWYRPYIDQEEYHRNVNLFDPNGPGPNTRLYDQPQIPAQRWIDHSFQFYLKGGNPHADVNPFGILFRRR